ncbi:hypothetical protein B0T26DRAFT_842495 [Lasiosphaeria miniovina]|uniref:Zinc finger PHD-type domain-containing protein n=1 Tax=Lasiosphaeria miniovina TaxID=1954250 RepID=A0AA40BFM3_9PEZI|nr:uncharacterized protein B0T26DRAFT_842495 [Lasiosphaeria miniovina]KAK0733363.1 hypothetical protein B0T26DRAFT_842495 [Lasiosphaeria miniovina]
MPATRKRALPDADSENVQHPEPPSMLQRIRNMWQFANLFQFILLFGKALKLDDNLDIEDLEAECLKPGSMALQNIGLGFLKFLSSYRGLTHELFDEYTRRQYISKAPEKNPFGTEETAARFADFDVFTKVRVLQQMTQFIMMSPERLREKTEEQKDMDQTNWRIEPYGWDHEDRTYFVLDDNRIYRQTEAPPPPTPKKGQKKGKAHSRASKRRRVSAAAAAEDNTDEDGDETPKIDTATVTEDDGLGGMKWECVAVTLDEVRGFLSTVQTTRDSNEKVLRDQIRDHLVPILEKQEESRKRKQIQREKELLNLEKLAHAKRSSRIAGKAEQQKFEEQSREEERKRREEEAAKRKEDLARAKMEHERESRLMSRAKRLKEREARRLQHEEELAQLSEDSRSTITGPGRMSERRRLAEIEKNKQALKEIEEEEDDWIFDCACGVYGQIDDGSHSVACEKCNVWQHSKCLGIDEAEADQDDFHFVCESCHCRGQAEKEQRPRIIKIKVNRPGSSSSSPPRSPVQDSVEKSASPQPARAKLFVELEPKPPSGQPRPNGTETSGAVASAVTRDTSTGLGPQVGPRNMNGSSGGALETALAKLPPNRYDSNAFSLPHPNLSPPTQSDDKTKAYDTLFNHSTPAPVLGHSNQTHVRDKTPPSLTGNGNNPSPSKQPQHRSAVATKESPSAPREFGARYVNSTPSGPIVLPQLTPVQSFSESERRLDERPSPLPPSRGGLSPTKQSPAIAPSQSNSNSNSFSAARAAPHSSAVVFPPAAALSPSPQQQILTPPVKAASPQQDARVAQPQNLVQSTSS